MSGTDSIGATLRTMRRAAKLTQAALAVRLRCTPQRITGIERGKRQPTLSLLREWADACGRALALDFPPSGAKATAPAGWESADPELRRLAELLLRTGPQPADSIHAIEHHILAWQRMTTRAVGRDR